MMREMTCGTELALGADGKPELENVWLKDAKIPVRLRQEFGIRHGTGQLAARPVVYYVRRLVSSQFRR
jgi:hypothetical protein